MIKPLVPNFDHFKEILFQVHGYSEQIDPFIQALQAKVNIQGVHRFSALKLEKDQKGKWVVPQFSGYLIVENEEIYILLMGIKLEGVSQTKKINLATNVVFKANSVEDYQSHFKRAYKDNAQKEGFLESLIIQNEIADSKSNDGYVHRSRLMGLRPKGKETVIEYNERSCSSCLHQWKGSRSDFINGMKQVLSDLIKIRDKRLSHCDVKITNIFIQGTFNLSDYEGCTPLNFKALPRHYFAWCSTRAKLGIAIPFTDVYGWAISVGSFLWGGTFRKLSDDKEALRTVDLEYTIYQSLINQSLIVKEIANLRFATLFFETYTVDGPNDPLLIHVLFFDLVKEVIKCDTENFDYYKLDPPSDKPNPVIQVTLERCLSFLEQIK